MSLATGCRVCITHVSSSFKTRLYTELATQTVVCDKTNDSWSFPLTINSIVFVHGLSGHRERSWTFRKDASTSEDAIFWPGKLLPESFPGARILTYGYDSNVTSSRYLVQRTLYSHSQNLLANIKSVRRRFLGQSRPLIFIAHSLGGIVVKSALVYANRPGSEFQEIMRATVGLVFFATPHQGSERATSGQIVRNIAMLTLENDKRLKSLNHDSEWLQLQLELYKTISADSKTYTFYEVASARRDSGQYIPVRSSFYLKCHTDHLFSSSHSLLPSHQNYVVLGSQQDHFQFKQIIIAFVNSLVPKTLHIRSSSLRCRRYLKLGRMSCDVSQASVND